MHNEFTLKMLDKISEMKSSMEVAALKVEFISRYSRFTYEPFTYLLLYVFIDHYCTSELVAASHLISVDALFDAAQEDYNKFLKEIRKNEDLSVLEEEEKNIQYTDKIFISMVRIFNTMAEYFDDLEGWAAERIASTVLEWMDDYYANYWNSGETVHEYFLNGLMTTIGT